MKLNEYVCNIWKCDCLKLYKNVRLQNICINKSKTKGMTRM